jgi:hypothetical protein
VSDEQRAAIRETVTRCLWWFAKVEHNAGEPPWLPEAPEKTEQMFRIFAPDAKFAARVDVLCNELERALDQCKTAV